MSTDSKAAIQIPRTKTPGSKDSAQPSSGVSDTLTPRERDVLAHISEGFSNKRVARVLGISPETVKSHVKRIYSKLAVSTRNQCVSRAGSELKRWPNRIHIVDPTSAEADQAKSRESAALIRWILTEGREILTMSRFVRVLSQRLAELGVPLWQVNIYAATLHPQIHGFGWRWWRDAHATEELRIHRGIELTPEYLTSPMRETIEAGTPARYRLEATGDQFPFLSKLRVQGGTDYIVAPLNRIRQRCPVVAWATDRPGGFDERDLLVLEEIRPALAALVEVNVLRRTARNLFSIYHSRQVGQRIFDGQILRGNADLLRAVIMATDLRGFTALSDRLSGETVVHALDDYFEHVATAVDVAGGLVLKFIGDGALAIFNAEGGRESQAALAGLSAAREIIRRLEDYVGVRDGQTAIQLRAGVGLHIGEVLYGNVGAPDRLDFTVIGPPVNLAFRLESLTKDLGCPILASENFAKASPIPLSSLGRHQIRGLSEPEEVFSLPEHAATVPD